MHRYQYDQALKSRPTPPVPTGTFAVLPLRLWAELWSRRSLKRVHHGVGALRLVKVFANDA